MTRQGIKLDYHDKAKSYSCPQDLYIYLINGVVSKEDEREFGKSFIGNWVEDSFSFLFFSKTSDEEVSIVLSRHIDLSLYDNYHFTYDDWQGGGLDAIRIGQFLISTPWAGKISDEDTIPIILDPGVVFGNGLHPTTRDCMQALAYTYEDEPFNSVLDLGTGTGILAITAALLGADNILAVDLNPLCIKTAINNFQLNGLGHIICAKEGAAEEYANHTADLVLANIHYDVIAGFLTDMCHKNRKRIIISGLMRSQASDMKDEIKRLGLKLIKEWVHEMTWYTMLIEGGLD